MENEIEKATGLMASITEKGTSFLVDYGPRVLVVIVLFIIGMLVIKKLTNIARNLMIKRNVDASLIPFVSTMLNIVLKVLLLVSLAGMLGFETTSFIAILGAAGLAVGLALQGTLSNFAGGVLILIFKPFRVGDLIEAQGEKGTVKEIQIFVTILLTPENKTVIIPNGAISNGNITNYTLEGVIRVDLNFGISYDSDIKLAKNTLLEIMNNHPKALKNPAPFVGVAGLGDHAVNLAVRPYTAPGDYWEVYFDVYEAGKIALDKVGVTIPFPQVDVHMKDK